MLNITQVDSVKFGLDFARFANLGRKGSAADIDLDLSKARRQEAVQVLCDIFGEDHVAPMATFNTLSTKVAIRDVGKVLNEKQAKLSILRNVDDILSNLVEGHPLKAEKIQINLVETQSEPKQLGELIYNILPAAFANAVSLVLNKTITKLPLSGDTIYRGITEE